MKICKVEGCNRKYYGLGYCSKHYKKFKKYGDPLVGIEKELHGMKYTPEYKTWEKMKDRCCNRNSKYYKYYGGRGITICERWCNSFKAFFADMGKRPFPKAQIDRINNDGNYEPGNCKWVTCAENTRHTSATKLTMQKADEIRKIFKAGGITKRALGYLYKVHESSIGLIINNKTWVKEATV